MHCVACDVQLTPQEMSRKSPVTGEDYLLCTHCLDAAGLLHKATENPLAIDEVTDAVFNDTLSEGDDVNSEEFE